MNEPKFVAIKDGDCWIFVLPDFVDLQNSPAVIRPQYNFDMDYIFAELLRQSGMEKSE